MADYLNKTGLSYFFSRLKTIFASQDDLDALEDKVDDIIDEGGEPNVIETVKVNGSALTPVNKAVDISVPTKTSDLTNDGDGTSDFATESYVDTNGGKINVIKVNGTAQTITNKTVDISVPTVHDATLTIQKNGTTVETFSADASTNKTANIIVPTKTSDLTNDGDGTSDFATEDYVDENGGKIDVIQVNGTPQTITDKTVNISVPTVNNATLTIQKNGTNVATFTANSSTNQTANITVPTNNNELTNGAGYQTASDVQSAIDGAGYQTASDVETAINAKISSTYKASGSVAFANLPSLTSANEGKVYNVTDSFTTTSDFVEGAGKTYPAGTNVVIINISGSTYKYDVLSGFVDLSGYYNTTNLVAITTAEIDTIIAS